ncbi:MAG TPA: 6-phosphogluconolactonase [Candidatus Acidoferrales bacterium]|nr:6-phosphogluconolactonase [Candidatus Acidoferrales bacterium]
MVAGINKTARVCADLDKLSHAVIQECVRVATEAAGARGKCLIALSGGRTPERAFKIWAAEYREKMPWDKTHFFFGDERFVPESDEKSNYRMAFRALFENAPVPPENIHPIVTNFATADDAARAYEKVLREYIPDSGPSFDVLFLGLGVEGHTASLFPESPALREEKRWAMGVRVPAEPPVRITLTFPVLRRARQTFFLVAGEDKTEIVAKLRRGAPEEIANLPVAMLKPEGEVIWFLDKAADGLSADAKGI